MLNVSILQEKVYNISSFLKILTSSTLASFPKARVIITWRYIRCGLAEDETKKKQDAWVTAKKINPPSFFLSLSLSCYFPLTHSLPSLISPCKNEKHSLHVLFHIPTFFFFQSFSPLSVFFFFLNPPPRDDCTYDPLSSLDYIQHLVYVLVLGTFRCWR